METLQRAANAGSVSTGFDIDNSVKLEADNDERFTRTPSSAGNRKTWTFSAWVKRTELGANQILISAADTYLYIGSDDAIWCNFRPATENFFLATNRVFRDTAAWYHIVVQCDTTQGTASNRAKLWVNGVQETSLQNSTYDNMSVNLDTSMNNTIEHMIGRYSGSDDYRMSGYISEFYLVDGTALEPTDFGEFDADSGIWKPKAYAGSYGTNGFYLNFDNSGSLGADSSGNGHTWTLNNLTSADQATDTPTNNFATFNPLIRYFSTTINEGATKVTNSDTANWRSYVSSIAVQSGKWYAEFQAGGTSFIGVGNMAELTGTLPYTQYLGQIAASIGYYSVGILFYNGASQSGSFAGFGTSDKISVALDKDNGFVYFAKNGVWQNSGDPTSGATGTGGVALTSGNTGYSSSDYYVIGYAPNSATSGFANYGGYTTMSISSAASDADGYGTFEYAPPTGYYALCTKNLAEYG